MGKPPVPAGDFIRRHRGPWLLQTLILAATLAGDPDARAAEAQAQALTIERLFAAPDLAGASLRSPRISPDGRLVTYLRGADDDRDRLDLWAYDIARREHRRLVDARALMPADATLSAEEAARRERQRTSALSGIIEYDFAPDSRRILVPLGGDLYLYDLSAPSASAVRRLTQTPGYETDARFSPHGRYVSFVRDQNLYAVDLADGREIAITRGGGGTTSYGMAEFIAQEEMNRDTGYWWSPDESRIAYTRVEESGIPETERFEINARTVEVVRQRYPFTGQANADVELYVAPLAGLDRPVRVDLGANPDIYLARVNFFPDGRQLAVQRQSRDQKTLDLLRVDAATGAAATLLTERSSTWVPLTDELTFLDARRQFIWASSRSGFQHLYLYDYDGREVRQLTRGDHSTVGSRGLPSVRGVDERRGLLYFASPGNNPRERQLYRLRLDGAGEPVQVTQGAGWHSVTMSDDASVFLDSHSNVTMPPVLRLHRADGRLLQALVPNVLDATHPYAPYLADHAPTQYGTIAAADGQSMHYAITRPRVVEPGRRYPVIVDVYGGPGVQNVTNTWAGPWELFHQVLARDGYIVFALDNRGSGERGVRFESASHLRLASVEVEDQKAGVDFLRTLPEVDPARIGVMGWSYGGYMALMTTMRAPGHFAAGVAGAPVTDWRLYDTHYTERYLSTPQANPAGYEAADVLTYAAQLSRPLLLVHGMADDNVLFTHSTALMQALQQRNLPFDLMTYPGGKHGLIRHQDVGPHALHQMKAFFDRTLKRQPKE
jgi:dipeptidyl-peptidase-4